MKCTLKDFEERKLTKDQIIELFQDLINTGKVWKKDRFYKRLAQELIKDGACKPGKILQNIKYMD